jgi:hypothetical protein
MQASEFYTSDMARDVIHDAVKNALIKDGWTITSDPYTIKTPDFRLEVDLAADRPIAAERAGRKIVVEIKSFIGRSLITEFYTALGQYLTYEDLLQTIEPERKLFLAVSDLVFNDFFQLESIRRIVQKDRLAILVVNTASEEIVQWIS